jgi:glucan phosphoethanolaminetransferase (alkaline phosphatase superfamily)
MVRLTSYLLLTSICLAPTTFYVVRASLNPHDVLIVLVASLASLTVFLGLSSWIPRIVSLCLGVIGVLACIEVQFIYSFGSLIDVNAVALVVETNPAEAADLLSSLPLQLQFAIFLVAAASIIAMTFPWRPAPRLSRKIIAGSFAVLGVVIFCAFLPSLTAVDEEIASGVFPEPLLEQQQVLHSAFPAGLPFVMVGYIRERAALARALGENAHFRFGASRSLGALEGGRKIFVMVVGETSRADRWGVNGYQRHTTPLLSSRDDLMVFPEMYSYATFTRLSVPVILSRKPPQSRLSTFDEASVITAFKEAGFRTAWISLQAPLGFHESPVTAIAAEADEVVFLNPVDYRHKGRRDADSIPELKRLVAADDRDVFVVIHTLGSHFRYMDRYGPEFARFLPDRYSNKAESLYAAQDKEVLSNAYDNTILATDAFLAGLIETLDGYRQKSWMFYVSDHGEALFDDCRQESGHGQSSKVTHHVASVFWASPQFSTGNQRLMERLRGNASRLASTGMMFDTLSSLGGLEVPGHRRELDMTDAALARPPEIEALGLDVDRCSR